MTKRKQLGSRFSEKCYGTTVLIYKMFDLYSGLPLNFHIIGPVEFLQPIRIALRLEIENICDEET